MVVHIETILKTFLEQTFDFFLRLNQNSVEQQ